MFYYSILINWPDHSHPTRQVFTESKTELSDDDAVEQAMFEKKLDREDAIFIVSVQELTEAEYKEEKTENAES